MIERDGRWTVEEDRIYDGTNQGASESIRRYRYIRNAHLRKRHALTWDNGIRRLHEAQTAAFATLAGFDAIFNDGTQRVFKAQQTGASTGDIYLLDAATKTWSSQSQSVQTGLTPDMFMFANKMLLLDGSSLRAVDSSLAWTTPGLAGYSATCKFGTVYANRAVVAGNETYPYTIFPSAVRDPTSWNLTHSVDVTGTGGEILTSLGTIGGFLIAQTVNQTRVYWLGTSSPRDWIYEELSNQVGCTHHDSFVEVSRGKGRTRQNYAFFWSNNGPMMLAQLGDGLPFLVDLYLPIQEMCSGNEYQGMPGLDITRYDRVSSAYDVQRDAVYFGVTKYDSAGATENDFMVCIDVESAIKHAQGELPYAFIYFRDNVTAGSFPCDCLFPMWVSSRQGGVTVTRSGQQRIFGGRNGYIYELAAPGIYTDNGTAIPVHIRRDGYDGYEDGIRTQTKVLAGVVVRVTEIGNYTLYVRAIADGGARTLTSEISLNGDSDTWGDKDWGDMTWGAGEFLNRDGELGLVGQKFDIEIYDNGGIDRAFAINSLTLDGWLEDRRR